MVVEGGKVTRVRRRAGALPAGCRVVEGKGRLLTPGFMEPFSGWGWWRCCRRTRRTTTGARGRGSAKEPIRAALRASDGINPASALFPVARLGGVTAAAAVPSGGLVPGQSAWVTTDGSLRRSPLAHARQPGDCAGRDAVSGSRSEVLERLRELLFDAREYGKRKGDFEQNRMRPVAASRLDLEALQPVLAGTLPVVVAAERVVGLLAALELAREYGLKLIIAGGDEAWLVAKELAAAKVPVILQPTQNLPDRTSTR